MTTVEKIDRMITEEGSTRCNFANMTTMKSWDFNAYMENGLKGISPLDMKSIVQNLGCSYSDIMESPSWSGSGEPNWCEYLMWQPAKNSSLPNILHYKYYNDPDNDMLVEQYLGGIDDSYKMNSKPQNRKRIT